MTIPKLVTVPRHPTKAMLVAACETMGRRYEAMGADWFPVTNKVKAQLRWEAMLAAWEAESAPPARWEIAARAVARHATAGYPDTKAGRAAAQAYVEANWREVWQGWQG